MFTQVHKVSLWRLIIGALPSGELLRKKKLGTGGCALYNGQETLKHVFWYCAGVKDWWRWILSHVQQCMPIILSQFGVTFGLCIMPSSALHFCLQSIRGWLLYFIWSARNYLCFDKVRICTVTIPWNIIRTKVLEDCYSILDIKMKEECMDIMSHISHEKVIL